MTLIFASCFSSRGASVNVNILIPNDGSSENTSIEASNRMDGSEFSQYRWGLITPLRLAMTSENSEAIDLLNNSGGDAGGAEEVIRDGNAIPIYFLSFNGCGCRRRHLSSLPELPDGSCWVRKDSSDEIYYTNTFENGNEVHHHVLFYGDLHSSILIQMSCGGRL